MALGMLDYATALVEFRSAIADGDRRALFEIGLIYERGHGVPADPAEAARWYRKAAAEGDDLAPRALARRALARVEAKVAPVRSAAAPPVTRQKKAPAPKAVARSAFARVEAKVAPAAPPVARQAEAPAPTGLARLQAKRQAALEQQRRNLEQADRKRKAEQATRQAALEQQRRNLEQAERKREAEQATRQAALEQQRRNLEQAERKRKAELATRQAALEQQRQNLKQAERKRKAEDAMRQAALEQQRRNLEQAERKRKAERAKDAPKRSASAPPVTRQEKAPAPIALARLQAKAATPLPAAPPPAVRIGRTQFRAGLYGEAPPFFMTVLAPTERATGRRRPATGGLVFDLARVKAKDAPIPAEARLWAVRRGRDLFQEGRYAEATPFIEKALELSERQLGPEHAETGALLHDLAKLMRIQGRNVEAESLYKRSVGVFEKALGSEHPRVARSLDSLAGLYLVQGRLVDAEPLYGRSLAIREKALGPAHPLFAASLNNLAELYRGQGRYAEAESLHKRSLAISEKALGPEHPDVGLILGNLTELYRAQGRNAEAKPLYDRSLEILWRSGRRPAERNAPAGPTASPPGLL